MADMVSDPRADELTAIVHEIRERVRKRYPAGETAGIGMTLPDLLPVLHARDAAEAKVASIGSVNPRPSGAFNSIIQSVKRTIARALGWFVRDQIEFNRSVLTAVDATLEALNDVNRTFAAVGSRIDEFQSLRGEATELKDIRTHWIEWREEWQRKLMQNEIHLLRGLAETQAANEARLLKLDTEYRETVRAQHREFEADVEKRLRDLDAQFWAQLQKIRLEYETLIHNELRVVRQKAFASPSPAFTASRPAENPLDIDYARFADRFRGTEEYVRDRLRFYLPFFAGRTNVLDVGCGRGEFLEILREEGISARGVDLDEESVGLCRSKGLQAEVADVLDFLSSEPENSFDGIFAAQVVEHLRPEQVPQLVKLCASKLKTGGVLALETPNPECLAIFATHFYLDPTHTRPIPPGLLVFYFEESGLGGIEVHRLSPAAESLPAVRELPVAFRDAFFGGLDYGIVGRKL